MDRVLIFGTGEVANQIINDVKKHYIIMGFVDNAVKKQHNYFKDTNFMIYSPNEIGNISFDKIVVASLRYSNEIFVQLLELGIREHNIIFDYVCKKREIYIYDLFNIQTNNYDDYNRMDIIVKYMAIESYLNNEIYGIELYKKMQMKRLRISSDESENVWEEFKRLIDSVSLHEYEKNSYVICDHNMKIMDGAHRVAICLFFGIKMIPVKITPQNVESDYTIDWFWENDFTRNEIEIINNNFKKIYDICNRHLIAFLWPSAKNYHEMIKQDISLEIKIIKEKHIELNDVELADFVKNIYVVDDVSIDKINDKINHMMQGRNVVTILELDVKTPRYRLKESTSLPLSKKGEVLKKIIRTRYQNKIDRYYFDNIIHITDNYFQTDVVKKIILLPKDISFCFSKMSAFEYALTKMDVPYMVKNFPYCFPVHKDADIVCLKKDYKKIIEVIYKFAKKYCYINCLDIRLIDEKVKVRIRMEYMNFLIYQFDISYCIEGLERDFVLKAVSNRVWHNAYYELCLDDEIEVRRNEYRKMPQKKHHKEFLDRHLVEP